MFVEAREAARAVAAHVGFAAVSVVVAHAEVRAVLRGLDGEQAVGPDAAVAVAQAGDLRAGEGGLAVAVIDHDEIISGPVHFCEVQHIRAAN